MKQLNFTVEDLIIKYLNDDLTQAELNKLSAWLKSPENQAKFKQYTKLQYNLDEIYISSIDAYADIQRRIKVKERKVRRRRYLKIAAIGIVLLGLAGVSYFKFFNEQEPARENLVKLKLHDGSTKYIAPNQQNFTNKANRVIGKKNTLTYNDSLADEAQQIFYNTLSVPYGKTYSIVLADGTKVNLNSGSSLRYPTAFSPDSTNRQVYLDGEAYFDVTHNKHRPFIVITDKMNIRVLGTRFDVSSYSEDANPFAVLVHGKIEAENAKNQQKLGVEEGHKVFYKQNQLITKRVYLKKYTSWIHGELVFVNDSFKIIKHKLERKFDVKITNNYKALNNIKITARFSDRNIDQILRTFKAYKDFDVTRQGRNIVINQP